MMKRFARHILRFKLGREQGGIALMMVLALMFLAVPLVLTSIGVADQLALSSRVYGKHLTGMYSADAGIEHALWRLLYES